MNNSIIQEIKNILETREIKKDIDFNYMPLEETKVFLSSIQNSSDIWEKFDISSMNLTKSEIKKWQLIYLKLHDLYHQEINETETTKLEILTTVPIFNEIINLIEQSEATKLYFAYFTLGVSSLRINHSLENLISEKIILGEFVSMGGIESSIWGIKVKNELLPEISKNILEKVKKDKHHLLVKKYKNFIFDFL